MANVTIASRNRVTDFSFWLTRMLVNCKYSDPGEAVIPCGKSRMDVILVTSGAALVCVA